MTDRTARIAAGPIGGGPVNGARRPIIIVDALMKRYGAVEALGGIDCQIEEGEFFSLLGPSGCGKTTLLRLIAGFDEPTRGSIALDGQPMRGVPANRRPCNMVFQSYAIFPHLTVEQNVGYGLRRMKPAQRRREVEKALEMVDLPGYGGRASNALSGGQRQRVALARALVMRPKVLLLDEPLSALDKKLREQMQVELRRLQRAVGITFILVTHDQEEAMIMSDRIAVMFDGRIAQLDSPEGLYRRPVDRRVAEFIGVMNVLPARSRPSRPGTLALDVAALGAAELGAAQLPRRAPGGAGNAPGSATPPAGTEVSVGVRPEMFTILFDAEQAEREIEGVVEDAAYYGDMTYYKVRLAGLDEPVTVSMRNTAGRDVLRAGEVARVGWGTDSLVLLR